MNLISSLNIILLIPLFLFALYSIKKIKKYNSILAINGFDGIYFYFKNKNFINTGIWNFIDKKKYLLGKKLSKYSKEKILYGPYTGTKFTFLYGWSNIDFGPKYLGIYEQHIQKKIIYLKNKFKINFFVDCGAAEGYHTISLLKKKIFKTAIAYEIDKNSKDILKKNAIINGVQKKISIFSDANFSSLKTNINKKNLKKTLFLIDIEGGEFDLFSKEFCKYFSQCYFIIEDHNFILSDKKKVSLFYKNIKRFFKVEIVKDEFRNPLNFRILDHLSEDEKYLIMSEGRPKSMQWLVLYPKKK